MATQILYFPSIPRYPFLNLHASRFPMAYEFDASGRLKPPDKEALAKADTAVDIISLATGRTPDGTPYYAYVAVPPSKYRAFLDATRRGQAMVLSEYGRVIC